MFLPLLQTKMPILPPMAPLSQLQLLTVCILAASHTSANKIPGGTVRVVEHKSEPILVTGQRSAEMACRISLSNGSQLDHYNTSWFKGDTPVSQLKDSHRFTVSTNGSLIIDKPTYADLGVYNVRVHMRGQFLRQHRCDVRFLGEPSVENLGRPFNRIVGQNLELTCKVKGHPVVITWYKDDHRINYSQNDTGIQLMAINGAENAHLQITDLHLTDSGVYKCEAWSDFFNKTVSKSVTIRVTETYSSVMPFLGLVAEVVVLCTIIFFYERYEKKKTQKRSLRQLFYIKVAAKRRK